jgi:hypothetical protein
MSGEKNTLEDDYIETRIYEINMEQLKLKTKLHGLSPQANYTDRATAACR